MLLLELLLPLGEVVAEPLTLPDPLPPDGAVGLLLSVVVVELELLVVSDDRGVVGVLGDADGLVRSGTVPTLSVSVRLQASVMPPASARAQSPESNFFIADDPPLLGVSSPGGGLQRPCPWYDSSPRR